MLQRSPAPIAKRYPKPEAGPTVFGSTMPPPIDDPEILFSQALAQARKLRTIEVFDALNSLAAGGRGAPSFARYVGWMWRREVIDAAIACAQVEEFADNIPPWVDIEEVEGAALVL